MASEKRQSQNQKSSASTTKKSAGSRNAKATGKHASRAKAFNSETVKHRTSRSKKSKDSAPIIPSEQVEIDYSFDYGSLDHESEIVEMIAERYVGLNVFLIVMVLLAAAILWTGVKTSMQIQQYRLDYKTLQEMKQEYLQLQTEHKRLLIEQQTFSSTPQIATRAISKLNMFFPTFENKRILQPQSKQTKQTSSLNQKNAQINPSGSSNESSSSKSVEVNQ